MRFRHIHRQYIGCEDAVKERFYSRWNNLVANQRVVVGGDMNAHVGRERTYGWEGERGISAMV